MEELFKSKQLSSKIDKKNKLKLHKSHCRFSSTMIEESKEHNQLKELKEEKHVKTDFSIMNPNSRNGQKKKSIDFTSKLNNDIVELNMSKTMAIPAPERKTVGSNINNILQSLEKNKNTIKTSNFFTNTNEVNLIRNSVLNNEAFNKFNIKKTHTVKPEEKTFDKISQTNNFEIIDNRISSLSLIKKINENNNDIECVKKLNFSNNSEELSTMITAPFDKDKEKQDLPSNSSINLNLDSIPIKNDLVELNNSDYITEKSEINITEDKSRGLTKISNTSIKNNKLIRNSMMKNNNSQKKISSNDDDKSPSLVIKDFFIEKHFLNRFDLYFLKNIISKCIKYYLKKFGNKTQVLFRREEAYDDIIKSIFYTFGNNLTNLIYNLMKNLRDTLNNETDSKSNKGSFFGGLTLGKHTSFVEVKNNFYLRPTNFSSTNIINIFENDTVYTDKNKKFIDLFLTFYDKMLEYIELETPKILSIVLKLIYCNVMDIYLIDTYEPALTILMFNFILNPKIQELNGINCCNETVIDVNKIVNKICFNNPFNENDRLSFLNQHIKQLHEKTIKTIDYLIHKVDLSDVDLQNYLEEELYEDGIICPSWMFYLDCDFILRIFDECKIILLNKPKGSGSSSIFLI